MLTSIRWKERSCSVGCPVGVQIEPSVSFCSPTQMSGKPVCLNIGRHILLKDFSFHDLLVGLVRALKSFNTFHLNFREVPYFPAFGDGILGLG